MLTMLMETVNFQRYADVRRHIATPHNCRAAFMIDPSTSSAMSANSAAFAAKKGVGIILSATKSGLSVLSTGVSKVRKEYAVKHETSVLAELKEKGLSPADYLVEVLQKVFFLFMAGYKHEIAAAAQQAGKRLTDIEKSSVPLDAVVIFGHSACDECLKYGDFEKGKFQQNMQEFLNKARMIKDHFDRDTLVHDIYYALLVAAETSGTEWQDLEHLFRDATARIIASSIHATATTTDSRTKAAKAIYLFASQIRTCAHEAELKKQKALKDAENLLRKERERQHGSQISAGSQGELAGKSSNS